MTLPFTTPDPAIEAAVRAFASAADRRDVPAIEAATHPEFRVLVSRPGAETVTFVPRAAYLQLARDGKVGGTERTVQVDATGTRGALAWAAVTLLGPAARFDSFMTLARTDDGWRVVEDAAMFTPAAS